MGGCMASAVSRLCLTQHSPSTVFYDGEGVEDRKDDYEGSAECVSHYERIIGMAMLARNFILAG